MGQRETQRLIGHVNDSLIGMVHVDDEKDPRRNGERTGEENHIDRPIRGGEEPEGRKGRQSQRTSTATKAIGMLPPTPSERTQWASAISPLTWRARFCNNRSAFVLGESARRASWTGST